MKVTKEKLPKSLVALDIELDRDQVEKGLDRAARQLSQKYNIPGFRKGKAPRFIVENYFGRDALVEQATEDLINKSFKTALDQEQINPIGQASIETVNSADPFQYRVLVPIAPTVTIPEYRNIRLPLEIEPITDETVQRAMDALREKHVVLRELEEPRPAREGDQLTVKMESFVDGEPLEERDENGELRSTTLVLEPGRLVDDLYNGLLGVEAGNLVEVISHMPEDHANDRVRDKDITFQVQVEGIQERVLPDWDEVPVLENFEGTVDELREKTHKDLDESARNLAERKVLDGFIEQVVSNTEYDVPDVMIHDRAHELLHEQGAQFERYGITLDQMLQYRGKTHEQAIEELEPEAEQQLKTSLAMQEVVAKEELRVDNAEVNEEIGRVLQDYPEAERASAQAIFNNQLRPGIASTVLDRKLRERILAIASGEAPELGTDASDADTTSGETPALETGAQSDDTAAMVADNESPSVSDTTSEATENSEQSVAAVADDEPTTVSGTASEETESSEQSVSDDAARETNS